MKHRIKKTEGSSDSRRVYRPDLLHYYTIQHRRFGFLWLLKDPNSDDVKPIYIEPRIIDRLIRLRKLEAEHNELRTESKRMQSESTYTDLAV